MSEQVTITMSRDQAYAILSRLQNEIAKKEAQKQRHPMRTVKWAMFQGAIDNTRQLSELFETVLEIPHK